MQCRQWRRKNFRTTVGITLLGSFPLFFSYFIFMIIIVLSVRLFVFFTRLQKRRRWESNKKEKKKNNRHVTLLEKKRSKDNMGRGSKHDKSIIYNKKEKKLWGERERPVGTRDRWVRSGSRKGLDRIYILYSRLLPWFSCSCTIIYLYYL